MSKRTGTSKVERRSRVWGGVNYKPWLKIQDVFSKDRSICLKSIKTDRQHEFHVYTLLPLAEYLEAA